jgi:hypothetical protein
VTELAPLLDVTAVRVLARYFVELTFADGTERSSISKRCSGGRCSSRCWRTTSSSAGVAVDPDAGTIVWPNGTEISPRALYLESKPSTPADDHRRRG